MNIIKTTIEGLVIIEPKVYQDERGYFFESFNANEFAEKLTPLHSDHKCDQNVYE